MAITNNASKTVTDFWGPVIWLTAGEALEAGDIVAISYDDSASKAWKADADNTSSKTYPYGLLVAINTAASGEKVQCAQGALMSGTASTKVPYGGVGAGTPLFLSATDGDFTETCDTTHGQQVGVEISATEVLIAPAVFGKNTYGDNEGLYLGTGLDVSVLWNGTNLYIRPVTDDTGAIYFGDGTKDMDVRFTLGAAADYVEFDVGNKALEVVGDARIDFTNATVSASNTDGGIIKAGTSSARITQDTADMKFMSFYFDNGATSGDNRGMYLRLYLTGAGGGGEAARVFTTVEDVAAGTAHGAHISLNFGSTGSLTGLGVAMRGTFHIANQAWGSSGGTCSAVQAEIWSDGANSDPVGMTTLSFFRVVNGGNATGMADVDDDAVLFDISGVTSGSAKLWYDNQGTAPANVEEWLKIKTPAGVRYLAVYNAVV